MARNKVLNIRLSDAEYEYLKSSAEQCGISESGLARSLIFGNGCSFDDRQRNQEIFREISLLSNTVNQLYTQFAGINPQLCMLLIEGMGRLCQYLK